MGCQDALPGDGPPYFNFLYDGHHFAADPEFCARCCIEQRGHVIVLVFDGTEMDSEGIHGALAVPFIQYGHFAA